MGLPLIFSFSIEIYHFETAVSVVSKCSCLSWNTQYYVVLKQKQCATHMHMYRWRIKWKNARKVSQPWVGVSLSLENTKCLPHKGMAPWLMLPLCTTTLNEHLFILEDQDSSTHWLLKVCWLLYCDKYRSNLLVSLDSRKKVTCSHRALIALRKMILPWQLWYVV